ncbi:MAG: imidazole glycerol phosphate synthase subunit HisH [Alphaproteobacteria bacterium]|nr:imidazole glycerol phosphate synthase subunit HisH [Alphaproteobacteria bacterium]
MSKETIIIIDYGSGNLRSAAKAFEHVITRDGVNAEVLISDKAEDVLKADRIVLPGQGAFPDCMENLQATTGMIEAMEQRVLKDGKPFLGICVGMQLLASRGLEHTMTAGLDWVPGQVVPFDIDARFKIPQMGWNELIMPNSGAQDNRHPLLKSVQGSIESLEESAVHYYFVHSYMFECQYNHHVLGLTDYGGLYASIVGRDNIVGVQFHPEKSQDAGLQLLGDFMAWNP